MLEINCGNIDRARSILQKGLVEIRKKTWYTDSTHRDRASFLSHTLGMLELNSNRPSVALEIFNEGLKRYGNSSQLLLGAALCEMRMGKDDSARALFEMSVLNDRKHAQAWQAWGVMETRAGEFDTASTLFQCGIRSAPNHGALWHGYGKKKPAQLKMLHVKPNRLNHCKALLEGKRGNLEKSRM
jgi:Tfp pilus assembly protein PilF